MIWMIKTARARAFLFYSFVIRSEPDFLEQGGRQHDRLLATCAALLTEIERADALPLA
jgi:hypothetical protein